MAVVQRKLFIWMMFPLWTSVYLVLSCLRIPVLKTQHRGRPTGFCGVPRPVSVVATGEKSVLLAVTLVLAVTVTRTIAKLVMTSSANHSRPSLEIIT